MKEVDSKLEQVTSSSSPYLPQSLTSINNELSLYRGELTDKCILENVRLMQKAFPALPVPFYDVLIDRLRGAGFCDSRLNDAVLNVIDNCIYPTPTIAQVISFDRRIKTYKYDEICELVFKGFAVLGETHCAIRLPDRSKPVWVHVDDFVKYKLKPWRE